MVVAGCRCCCQRPLVLLVASAAAGYLCCCQLPLLIRLPLLLPAASAAPCLCRFRLPLLLPLLLLLLPASANAFVTAASKTECTEHAGKLAAVSLGFEYDQSEYLCNNPEVAGFGCLNTEGTAVPPTERLPCVAHGGVAALAF